jgi:hypothetical protein
VAQGKQRLDLTGYPFVFFADDTTGRGSAFATATTVMGA